MKAIIKTAYAVYSTDGSGYSQGDPLLICPFRAAAEASEENKKLQGYSYIGKIELLQFEEISYLLEKKISKDRVFGNVKLGIPEFAYSDYFYKDGWDNTKYLIGDEELIKYIRENKKASINTTWITRDESDYFVLKSNKTFSVKSFTMSRELAIKNALDKLTEEERKLLGI